MSITSLYSFLPITERRELVTSSTTHTPVDFAKKSEIKIDDSRVADDIISIPNGWIILTKLHIACMQNETVKWKKDYQKTDCSIAMLSDKKSLLVCSCDNVEIFNKDDGAQLVKKQLKVNHHIKPLVKPGHIIIIVDDRSLCCYDTKLEEKWRYEIPDEGQVQFFDFQGKTAVVSNKYVTFLNNEGKQITQLKHNEIELTFQASDHLLYIKDRNALYLIEVNSLHTSSKLLCSVENLEGVPVTILAEKQWEGFVSQLPPENKGYGEYEYRIGVFDGNAQRLNTISLDHPIQYFTVDAAKRIIIVSGPDLDIFDNYSTYPDFLEYHLTCFDVSGKKLSKTKLDMPCVSPFAINEHGELALFSEGNLHIYEGHKENSRT